MKRQDISPFNCYFISQKSHMDCPGIKPGPPHWEASDQQPEVKKKIKVSYKRPRWPKGFWVG